MKTIKTFDMLNTAAKIKAMSDYHKGWLETHPEETNRDLREIIDILEDGDGVYTDDGDYLGED